MNEELWTVFFLVITLALYRLQPNLDIQDAKKAVGIAIFFELFYIIGSFISDGWPFPTPLAIIQVMIVVAMGVALGAIFSKFWPLPPKVGMGRVVRIFILCAPAISLGIGMQIILQGNDANQAIYLLFALAAWLSSGKYRMEDFEGKEDEKNKGTVKNPSKPGFLQS